MEPALLEGAELAYSTAAGTVLSSGLSFQLFPGQILLVTGPNGSGKSTLLRVLLRQFPVTQGLVRCTVPQEKIALIPQLQNMEFHLPMTLIDVLDVATPGKLDLNRALSLGLLTPRQLRIAWNTASGGERQRTMLTRALMQRPSLLMLDEPLNHLDVASQSHLMETLVRFLKDRGEEKRAIVLVSHASPEDWKSEGVEVVHLELAARPPRRGRG